MTDLTWLIASAGILALILLLGVVVLWRTVRERRSGFPRADERTQKLNGQAAYYAMFMCQYFIIAYLLVTIVLTESVGMPAIEAGYPMIAALLVSAVSFLVLRRYFDAKGEQ